MADLMIKGVEYYRLQVHCPIDTSSGYSCYVDSPLWYHGEDEGEVFVGSDATLYCAKCKQSAKIMQCTFSCPQHAMVDDYYVYFDKKGSVAVLAELIGFTHILPIVEMPWIRKFLIALENG